jgi:hypothetical protein
VEAAVLRGRLRAWGQQERKARQLAGPFAFAVLRAGEAGSARVRIRKNRDMRESGCLKLLEVTLLMADVILNEEADRDRSVITDDA